VLEPRRRQVLRDVWLYKARTLLVVLAVAAGLAGAGTVLDAWALVRRATREQFLASSPASATLTSEEIDPVFLALVEFVPGARDAQARRTVLASVRTPDGVGPFCSRWRTSRRSPSG
jgi:putative ABC transport system permease protein